jgi:hypothetical protein
MVEHQRYNSCHLKKGVSEIMKYQTQTTLNKWAHILVKRKEKNELIKCESYKKQYSVQMKVYRQHNSSDHCVEKEEPSTQKIYL